VERILNSDRAPRIPGRIPDPVSSRRVTILRSARRWCGIPIVVGVLAAMVWLAGCGKAVPRPILLFAAASLEDSILEVATAFTSRTGTGVALNTAGSNVLAQQIEAGAPADVFVSADARWIDELIASGSLDPASRRELLSNRLVVVAHSGAGYSLESLSLIGALPFRYLSIADPDSVPAGRYARSLLEHTPRPSGTAWDEVAARVAPAPDVRAALAVVAAEPDAIGIVYRSDVMGGARDGNGGAGGGSTRGVEVLLQIEREPDPPIRYVGALVRRSGALAPESAELLDFLGGDEASVIFERHGFLPLSRPR
jgi:molybdate transport system substrate-binding protein